ncbi:hypothetical protein Syun_008572 [Stephania yunnanensis]|uniref:Uncharacterized protein n=1 Tax=Stephania yunnanensis TaxID=152371 RepID=A0AAP0PMP8_9MAGN
MDTKSLAKSKRAHSQHHHSRKPRQQASKSKSSHFHGSSSSSSSSSTMPSNWDRYEEETEEPGLGDQAGRRASEQVVAPKSKGADFRHLISEAQSQLQSRSQSGGASERLSCYGSFDDDLPDLLSKEGNGIMSWVEDDNFVVDGDSSIGYEASFFSLDLHALAAQLEKIDVSKRLFIEEDLLPPELGGRTCTLEAERNMQGKSEILPAQNASGFSTFPCEGTHVVDQGAAAAIESICISPSDEDKVTYLAEDKSKHFDQTNLGDLVDFIAQLDQTFVSESNEKKVSKFKAFDAEAELDTLLGSFGRTNLLDSSGTNKMPNGSFPVAKWNSGTVFDDASSHHATQQPLENGISSSRSIPTTVNLEDKVDDLLEELSSLKQQDVDDLLAEASNLQEKKGSVVPLQHDAKLTDFTKSSPQSSAKLMDDFNSWLDTI